MTIYDTMFEGDEGTHIELEIQDDGVTVDISTASVKNIKLTKPGGPTLTKAGQFSTDGTDGLLFYSTEAAVMVGEGLWSARAYVEIGSWKGHSTVYNFLVREVT